MANLGWDIQVFPLIHEQATVIHPAVIAWNENIERIALISALTLRALIGRCVQQPVLLLKTFLKAVRGNLKNPKFLARTLALFPKAVYLASQTEKQGIAHLHVHFATHPAMAAWIIKELNGLSYSVTTHAHDIYVSQTMLAEKLKAAEFVVSISEFNRRFLSSDVDEALAVNTNVIYSGINLDRYPKRDRSGYHHPFRIFSIGSLEPYKGQSILIEACRLLQQADLSFICCIAGEGELRAQLDSQIERANLTDCVRLLGNLTEEAITRELSVCDGYAQPSIVTAQGKMEGIPVSLMEALACELPVVASNISGISELVREGETGRLVPAADPAALASVLIEMMTDPDRHLGMAKAGRRHVEAHFDLTVNVKQLNNLIVGSLNG